MKYTIQQRDHITIDGMPSFSAWRNIETFEDHDLAFKELCLLQKNRQITDQYQIVLMQSELFAAHLNQCLKTND